MGGRKGSLLEKTAQLLDLPADAMAGVPRLELVGTGELRMENHKGILAYGSEEIHISCRLLCGAGHRTGAGAAGL